MRSLVKPYPGAYTYRDKHDTPHQLFVWQSRLVCEQTSDVGVPGHSSIQRQGQRRKPF
ncbi:MAG: hypothetical protein R2857_09060 [Vampirovibrionales bacterium]